MPKPKSSEDVWLSAETSQLSSDGYRQMIEHPEHCPSCRKAHAEFSHSLQQLPSDERDRINSALRRHLQKRSLQERFIERACAEGIQFSAELDQRESPSYRGAHTWMLVNRWVAATAAVAIIAIGIGYRTLHQGTPHSPVTTLHEPARTTSTAPDTDRSELEAKVANLQTAVQGSKQTISELRVENAAMLLRIGGLEKELGASQSARQALQQALAGLNDQNAQLSSQNDHNAQLWPRARADLEQARLREAQTESELDAQKAEVGSLTQQIKSQSASISRDITDLMGARNLHIIDVHDADGKGKNQKAFGRIFYTGWKSLIFYAYDLDTKKLSKANYSFDVWGERLGEPTSVRNLGMLYTDDKDQKWWMLTVDEPQQLAEIDSVFVTLEPPVAGDKPFGQRVLFAYLGGRANHP